VGLQLMPYVYPDKVAKEPPGICAGVVGASPEPGDAPSGDT
jgi:hypothetical protein